MWGKKTQQSQCDVGKPPFSKVVLLYSSDGWLSKQSLQTAEKLQGLSTRHCNFARLAVAVLPPRGYKKQTNKDLG